MVKKLKKMAQQKASSPAGMLDNQLASAVKASAQQIWLAGMGAFAKAQEEGGKVFEALVKEGVGLQRRTQAVAEERLGEVTGKMSAMAGEVTTKANASWDKLESIFEARTAKALGKLGVPTAKDVAELTARVDALASAVAKLGGDVPAPKRSRRAAAPAADKPAAKKAAPRTKAAKAAAPAARKAAPAKAAPRKAAARKASAKAATAATESTTA
jgi:poly(hydroxyalkanoate) granule-associated protein